MTAQAKMYHYVAPLWLILFTLSGLLPSSATCNQPN